MNWRILICLMMTATALLSPVARSQQTAPTAPRVDVISLELHAAAATRPSLRYPLLPEVIDQRPGNGATLYLSAARIGPDPKAAEELTSKFYDKFRVLPTDQLAKADVAGALQPFAERLEVLDIAARREEARWDTTLREQGAAAQLPFLNDMRINARILSLKASWQIARHDWPAARRTLQTAFAMARHMNDHPLLIHGLIEAGITDLFLDRVTDWMEQPGAPNLYWALTDLPDPFIDLASVRRWEQSMIYFTFPALASSDPERITPEQWRDVFANMDRMSLWQGNKPMTRLELTWLIASTYPQAKQALVAGGASQEKVDAMSVDQVVGLYLFKQFLAASDDAWKAWQLPYWQGFAKGPDADPWETRRRQIAENPFMALIPIVSNARLQFARIDRKICLLRVIESLRDYSASHENHFPQSLDDLAELPAPINPVTGRPFPYRFTGGTAVIEVEADYPKGAATEYRLTLAR
jgi:hypothetical protein